MTARYSPADGTNEGLSSKYDLDRAQPAPEQMVEPVLEKQYSSAPSKGGGFSYDVGSYAGYTTSSTHSFHPEDVYYIRVYSADLNVSEHNSFLITYYDLEGRFAAREVVESGQQARFFLRKSDRPVVSRMPQCDRYTELQKVTVQHRIR